MEIRREQVDAVQQARLQDYYRELLTEFRQDAPEALANMDDATALDRIAAAAKRAAEYGIESDQGRAKFIALAVLIDPDFDKPPVVRRFLTATHLDPDLKIKMLADRVAHQLREKAAR